MINLKIQRVKLDFSLPESSRLLLETWRGNASEFHIAVYNGNDISTLSNVQSINCKIRSSQTGTSVLADSTISSFGDITSDATWNDGSEQHGVFSFSNSEMNFNLLGCLKKDFWIVFTATLTGGEERTLGAGTITFNEDNNAAGDPPPENAGSTITLEQADSRYLSSDPHFHISSDITDATDNGSTDTLLKLKNSGGAYPVFVAIPANVGAYYFEGSSGGLGALFSPSITTETYDWTLPNKSGTVALTSDLDNEIIYVLTESDRINPASYPDGFTVGVTRVIVGSETDTSGILWTIEGSDLSLAESWTGISYTRKKFVDFTKVNMTNFGKKGGIILLGDSLTVGFASGSIVDEQPFEIVRSLTGLPTIHKARSGYIPRHSVYDFLIKTNGVILLEDLLLIPPTELENRIHQPAINNSRDFYDHGQLVWAKSDSGVINEYKYFKFATTLVDNITVFEPAGGVGRWLKEPTIYTEPSENELTDFDFVIWLGNNGFEFDDFTYAYEMLLRNISASSSVAILTISNRLPDTNADITLWNTLTENFNNSLFENYANVIDLDGWIMNERAHVHDGLLHESTDSAQIALGIIPDSIRSGTDSHFSQEGYIKIWSWLSNALIKDVKLPAYKSTDLMRSYHSTSNKRLDESGKLISWIGSMNRDTDTALINGNLFTNEGKPRIVYDSTINSDCLLFKDQDSLYNDFDSDIASPNTYALVLKVDELPAVRMDILGSPSTSARNQLSIHGGEFRTFQGSAFGVFGITADTDWHVMVIAFNNGSSKIWLDGTEYTTASTPGSLACSGIRISNETYPFIGKLAHLDFYTTEKSSLEMSEIGEALQTKYNL